MQEIKKRNGEMDNKDKSKASGLFTNIFDYRAIGGACARWFHCKIWLRFKPVLSPLPAGNRSNPWLQHLPTHPACFWRTCVTIQTFFFSKLELSSLVLQLDSDPGNLIFIWFIRCPCAPQRHNCRGFLQRYQVGRFPLVTSRSPRNCLEYRGPLLHQAALWSPCVAQTWMKRKF